MTAPHGPLAFVRSLAGRMTLLLTLGMTCTAVGSLLIAEKIHARDFERMRMERVVASTTDIADRLARAPERTNQLLNHNRILGARTAPADWTRYDPDPQISQVLNARMGPGAQAGAMLMRGEACLEHLDLSIRAAGMREGELPDCWYVRFIDAHGMRHGLAIDLRPFHIPDSKTLDPVFIGMVVAASALIALVAAGLATVPLRRLTEAARAFSLTIDAEQISEEGPSEVRQALRTFNIMQDRVRSGFHERTQLLASITHDLQTPLTRLRLRLEQVPVPTLRERLVADLAATQRLVNEGLDLARSTENREPWTLTDIDSILSSVAEDAASVGADVCFRKGCGLRLRVKPNALLRTVGNLVDNAVKYGGGATLESVLDGADLVIHVRDHGPGIPEAQLEEMLQPFTRLDRDKGAPGTGIGLAIAQSLAKTFGARVALADQDDGGLLASIVIAIPPGAPARRSLAAPQA